MRNLRIHTYAQSTNTYVCAIYEYIRMRNLRIHTYAQSTNTYVCAIYEYIRMRNLRIHTYAQSTNTYVCAIYEYIRMRNLRIHTYAQSTNTYVCAIYEYIRMRNLRIHTYAQSTFPPDAKRSRSAVIRKALAKRIVNHLKGLEHGDKAFRHFVKKSCFQHTHFVNSGMNIVLIITYAKHTIFYYNHCHNSPTPTNCKHLHHS